MTTIIQSPSRTSTSSLLLAFILSSLHPHSCQSFQFQSPNPIIHLPQPSSSSSLSHHHHHHHHHYPSHTQRHYRFHLRQQYLQQQSNNRKSSNRHRQYYQQRLASISAEYDDWRNSSSGSGNSATTANKNGGDKSLGEKVRTVTVAYIDEIAKTQFNQDDDDDLLVTTANTNTADDIKDGSTSSSSSSSSSATQKKRERIVLDVVNGRPTFTYEIQLPIVGTTPQAIGDNTNVLTTSVDLSQTVGLTLNEIQSIDLDQQQQQQRNDDGFFLGESRLEMDTLRYVSSEEQSMTDQKLGLSTSYDEEGVDGSIQILNERKEKEALISSINGSSSITGKRGGGSGVIVSRIVRGGIAWKAGVRAGDRIIATSATVGEVSRLKKRCMIFMRFAIITKMPLTLFNQSCSFSYPLENMAKKHIGWS